jgi:hypothetical protein
MSYKVKATVVSVNLQTMQLTYSDGSTGASGSVAMSSKAARQSAGLKAGTRVTLHVQRVQPSNSLVVQSISKKSHKKLIVVGLVLATAVIGMAVIASAGPI